jgi:hypothetical protein
MAGDSGHVGTAANGEVALWQANEKDGEFTELPMRRLYSCLVSQWENVETLRTKSISWKA